MLLLSSLSSHNSFVGRSVTVGDEKWSAVADLIFDGPTIVKTSAKVTSDSVSDLVEDGMEWNAGSGLGR